jgi:hypothetical protein
MKITLNKSLLASSITLALGTANVEAALIGNVYGAYDWSTDSANFTMLSAGGGVVGGTNDVNMVWDGNAYNASSDYTGPGSAVNVTASSTAPFFGHSWTAHDIQVFLPGTYSFDVTLGGGVAETGLLTATVGPGQLGMHMLFDWNGGLNIDVFVVANANGVFGAGLLYSTQTNVAGAFKCGAGFTGTIIKNCLYDGPQYGSAGQPVKNQVWMLASADGNGDGIMGIPMVTGGPFAGFNANFMANMTATLDPPPSLIPVPAAAWLLGSGLMGLVAAARRRKPT